MPIGHSMSLAARLQALAPVGSIATTASVRSVCEGYFVFKDLGPTRVKGVSELINVFEVTGIGPLRTRLQRSAGRGLTKFVGRKRELEALDEDDDSRKRREKVAGKITILDRELEDTLPYVFDLLGIVDGDDPLAELDTPVQERRKMEAIKRILLRESLNQPVMVVFEDLHWIDEQARSGRARVLGCCCLTKTMEPAGMLPYRGSCTNVLPTLKRWMGRE